MKKLTEIFKTFLNQRIIIAALMLIVFQSGSAFSAQDTIKLTALQDNTLYEDAAGSISNGQGKYLYSGKGSTGSVSYTHLDVYKRQILMQQTELVIS